MFLKQTGRLLAALAALPAEAAALTHTLKGSARAIGAFRVADAPPHWKRRSATAAISASELAALQAAVAEARGPRSKRGSADP